MSEPAKPHPEPPKGAQGEGTRNNANPKGGTGVLTSLAIAVMLGASLWISAMETSAKIKDHKAGSVEWWDSESSSAEENGEEEWKAGGRAKGTRRALAAQLEAAVTNAAENDHVAIGTVGEQVEDWLETNMTGDVASATEQAYGGMWSKWAWFCRARGQLSEVLNRSQDKKEAEDLVLSFLGYLGWLGAPASTLKTAVFALKSGHKRLGAGDPTQDMHRVWILVNGLSRRAMRKARRLGATRKMLEWIADRTGNLGLDGAMLNAAVQTAWFWMMRMKEFGESGGVDLDSILRGKDVHLSREGDPCEPGEATEASVEFRKTKVDQVAFGITQALHASGDMKVCAVGALDKLRALAPERFSGGSEEELPLFR